MLLKSIVSKTVSVWRTMSKKCKLDVSHICSVNSAIQIASISTGNVETSDLDKSRNSINLANHPDVKQLASPVKSESDRKEYTTIQLANGLKVLLISDTPNLVDPNILGAVDDDDKDEETDEQSESGAESNEVTSDSEDSSDGELMMANAGGGSNKDSGQGDEKLAACSLTVGVGSFCDPTEIQGLAHFLEHMLFMGSKKYPKENEFDSFIKRKGGSDNASTECEYTTYYFECHEKFLLKGMDIFSQFFISPLLKKEAMTREREAIESEFQMALPSDSYRREQLICSLASDSNPAKKFTWGNLTTLRDSVEDDELHKAVGEFWRKYYSSHRMTLAVQARLPTEMLIDWVVKCFSDVPNNYTPPPAFPLAEPSFKPALFNKFYLVEAVQEMYMLEVNWALPPCVKLYKSKPLSYLSWLIGHEGDGSLVAFLRRNLWASGLTSGHSDDGISFNSLYTLFSINIVLSDKGKENINNVLKAIFSYIKLLQNEGPNERIFREIQGIDRIQFRFSEEDSAVGNVETLSENMQYYPPEDFITGSELTYEYRPDEIECFLKMMTPNNANIILNAHSADKNVVYDSIEPWFKTRYTSNTISVELMQELNNIEPYKEFHQPEPNQFIATDFSLLPEDTPTVKYPQKCYSTEILDVYYKADMKFRLPMGYVGFNIVTPKPEQSAKSGVTALLYLKMLKYTLIKKTYPANMALLEDTYTACERGLNISFYGLTDKLHLLLNCVADGIKEFNRNITEELFTTYKKMSQQGLTNINLKVSSLEREVRMSLLLEKYWTSASKFRAIQHVTLEDVKSFADEIYRNVHVQCLVQGNFSEDRAIELCANFVNSLDATPLSMDAWPTILVHELPNAEHCCRVSSFNYEDKNCKVTNYFQYGPASIREYCIVEMLQMLMEEPMFDQLRTQQQLGYDVSCTVRDTFGILGFSLAVNSQIDKYTVNDVESRITEFLNGFVKTLKNMSDNEYNEVRQSLINVKQCSDLHLKEEVKRNWDEINSCEYAFDRLEREIAFIRNITKDDVLALLKACTNSTSDQYRKLTVQIVGHKDVTNSNAKRAANSQLNYEFLAPTQENKTAAYFIDDFDKFKENLPLFPPSKIV